MSSGFELIRGARGRVLPAPPQPKHKRDEENYGPGEQRQTIQYPYQNLSFGSRFDEARQDWNTINDPQPDEPVGFIKEHRRLIVTFLVLLALAAIGTGVCLLSPDSLQWLKHTFSPLILGAMHSWHLCALGAAGVATLYLMGRTLHAGLEEEKTTALILGGFAATILGLTLWGVITQVPQLAQHWDVILTGSATAVTLLGCGHYLKWAATPLKIKDEE